ncbi:MAG: class I tRNA ligase family protein, partial [Armatimonadota bacterium]
DVLRTWVATVDYETDMPCTEAIIKASGDLYRSVRNTLRFLLMNLYDFDPAAPAELQPVDTWIVQEANRVAGVVTEHYRQYEFAKAFAAIHNFCVNELSRFYLDAVKDRMYCDGADWPSRRGAQAACHKVLYILTLAVSPILAFTADETYENIPAIDHKPSVFHEVLSPETEFDKTLEARVRRMLDIRGEMAAALEVWKTEAGIKDSQDVEVNVHAHGYDHEALHFFLEELPVYFRVAAVHLHEGPAAYSFKVSELAKCERSRVRRPGVEVVDYNGEQVALSPRDRKALGLA